MKQATYPANHKPAMRVPVGGSSCAKCAFHRADGNRCDSPDYQKYYGTDQIPLPPDQFCSDWFEAGRAARKPVAAAESEPEDQLVGAGSGAFYGQ